MEIKGSRGDDGQGREFGSSSDPSKWGIARCCWIRSSPEPRPAPLGYASVGQERYRWRSAVEAYKKRPTVDEIFKHVQPR